LEHATTKPVPPSNVTEMEIPEDLENLIMACLEKNPADRPQSAEDLVQRLRELNLLRSWDQESARVWWKLHRP
jgi:serine/threonine-protein kinase